MRIQTINKKINTMKLDMNHVLGELELKLKTFLEKHNIDAAIDVNLDNVTILVGKEIPREIVSEIESQFLLKGVELQKTYVRDVTKSHYYVFEHKKIHKYQ